MPRGIDNADDYDRYMDRRQEELEARDDARMDAQLTGPTESEICSACNGSGEGAYDGSCCMVCGGSGEVEVEEVEHDEDLDGYA